MPHGGSTAAQWKQRPLVATRPWCSCFKQPWNPSNTIYAGWTFSRIPLLSPPENIWFKCLATCNIRMSKIHFFPPPSLKLEHFLSNLFSSGVSRRWKFCVRVLPPQPDMNRNGELGLRLTLEGWKVYKSEERRGKKRNSRSSCVTTTRRYVLTIIWSPIHHPWHACERDEQKGFRIQYLYKAPASVK